MQQITNKRPQPLKIGKHGIKYIPIVKEEQQEISEDMPTYLSPIVEIEKKNKKQDTLNLYIINSVCPLDQIADELNCILKTNLTVDNLKIFYKEGDNGELIDTNKSLVMLTNDEFKLLLNRKFKFRLDKFYVKALPAMKNTTIFFRLDASSCDISIIDAKLKNLFRNKAPIYTSKLPTNEDKSYKGFGFLSFIAPYNQIYFAKALLNNEIINGNAMHTSWNKKQVRNTKQFTGERQNLRQSSVTILTKPIVTN